MKAEANYKNIVESISLTLDLNEALWLYGVIGAQTDGKAIDLYRQLGSVLAEASGIAYRDLPLNDIVKNAGKMAKGQRYEFTSVTEPKETDEGFACSFTYDGIYRFVTNPVYDGKYLKGTEEIRGVVNVDQFKTYLTDKITNLKFFPRGSES